MIKVEIESSDYFCYEHLLTAEVLTFINSLRKSSFKKDDVTGKYYYELSDEQPSVILHCGDLRYEVRQLGLGKAEVAPPVMASSD